MQARIYYVVELLPQNNLLDRIHCVPSTWIKWQSKERSVVLVAYPDEPQEVTEKRAKIYEKPAAHWNLHPAEIKDISDSFVNVVRRVQEEDRRVEGPSGSGMFLTKSRSPGCFGPSIASLSPGMKEGNTFWSEYQRWRSNFVEVNLPMINPIDKIIESHSEVVKSLSDQEDGESDDSVSCDLSMKSRSTNQNSSPRISPGLGQEVDNLDKPAYHFFTWQTLKHQRYSPGLVELVDNTGVYIGKRELDYCLASSIKCTKLARLLTEHVFTESALRNCLYVGVRRISDWTSERPPRYQASSYRMVVGKGGNPRVIGQSKVPCDTCWLYIKRKSIDESYNFDC